MEPYAVTPQSWERTFSKAEFHQAGEFTFKEEAKARGRGRPRKGDEDAFVYFLDDIKIKQRVDVVRKTRLDGACFVIGNNDTEAPADEILRHYLKDQQGVERSFRFLKDPEYFADAFFLKSPSRIAALLCVMTLALLLFALVQRRIRLSLEASGKTVPDQKRKQTRKPTLRWVNQEFGLCHEADQSRRPRREPTQWTCGSMRRPSPMGNDDWSAS